MTIEISCPQCFANLRVPEEAVGAQAKCPHCREVFDVNLLADTLPGPPPVEEPASDSNVPPIPSPYAERPSVPQQTDLNNPYAAPATPTTLDERKGIEKGPMSPGRLDAGMTFSLAWELFTNNLPLLLMTHTTAFVISVAISMTAEACNENGMAGLYFALTAISYPIQWFFVIGLTSITLGLARGQQMEFNDLFGGGPYFVRVALYLLLYSIMVLLGCVFFLIPGIYLALRYWPGAHFIVDRDVTVWQAFELSSRHTQGNFLQTILTGMFGIGVLCAGLMILTYGMYSLMWTIAFLMITRQPIHRVNP